MKVNIFLVTILLLVETLVSFHLFDGDECYDQSSYYPGVCCPFDTCQSAKDDFRNNRGRPMLCSFHGNIPIVCCRYGCSNASSRTTENPSRITEQRISQIKCAEYSDRVDAPSRAGFGDPLQKTIVFDPTIPDLATENTGGANKVTIADDDDGASGFFVSAIGGQDTELNEFPHMVAIGWNLKSGGFSFQCGGSLISETFVLTAGHCLSNPRDSTLANPQPTVVRLGDQNILEMIIDGASPIDVPIKRFIKHPEYKPPGKYYDIALLELQQPVQISKHIRPACLWPEGKFQNYSSAIVTGWGTTVSGVRENSAVLQKVTIDILENEVCDPLLIRSRNRHWKGFHQTQLCAGVLAGGKDACQGDSGGPLQIQASKTQFHIIGVTSFGRECGKANLPGVYTRVSAFIDWIESQIWPSTNTAS